MQISNQLKKYIISSVQISKSNIIITDLQKVNLVETMNEQENRRIDNYLLNSEIVKIIDKWKIFQPNLYLLLNREECLKIFQEDSINYSCQMLFPIFVREKLVGLLILFRTSGNYIASSIKSTENLRKFISKFIEDTNEKEGL